MRVIKFRGKRVDNGEWVYGDLIQYRIGEVYILEQNFKQWDVLEGGYLIDPKTVGQYTGLKDRYGTEIYEEDICWDSTREWYGIVKYSEGCFEFCWDNIIEPLSEVHNDISTEGSMLGFNPKHI